MPYVSKEQLTAAREVDLLTYLRCFEPQELVHISGSTYGVTEQLKAENQIEWVRQMNACVAQAEEAIKGELIYC